MHVKTEVFMEELSELFQAHGAEMQALWIDGEEPKPVILLTFNDIKDSVVMDLFDGDGTVCKKMPVTLCGGYE